LKPENELERLCVVGVEVIEPVNYEKYKILAGPTVIQYSERYLSRCGAHETLDGNRDPTGSSSL